MSRMTYSHAAIYLGGGQVTEMLGDGYTESALSTWYARDEEVAVYRHQQIGGQGTAFATAVRSHAEIGLPRRVIPLP